MTEAKFVQTHSSSKHTKNTVGAVNLVATENSVDVMQPGFTLSLMFIHFIFLLFFYFFSNVLTLHTCDIFDFHHF